jgi:calcineurin-like phosphoesterase family protein
MGRTKAVPVSILDTVHFTSDEHYSHKRISEYCGRPFEKVEDMDEHLIREHNKVVRMNHTVYHLGDFTFQPMVKVVQVVSRLNGRHFFVRGNHDKWFDTSDTPLKTLLVKNYLGRAPMHELKFDGKHIVMCHYPIVRWNKAHHGSMQVYGHCHSGMEDKYPRGRQMDVGVDNAVKLVGEYRPFSLREVLGLVETRPINPYHNEDEGLTYED